MWLPIIPPSGGADLSAVQQQITQLQQQVQASTLPAWMSWLVWLVLLALGASALTRTIQGLIINAPKPTTFSYADAEGQIRTLTVDPLTKRIVSEQVTRIEQHVRDWPVVSERIPVAPAMPPGVQTAVYREQQVPPIDYIKGVLRP